VPSPRPGVAPPPVPCHQCCHREAGASLKASVARVGEQACVEAKACYPLYHACRGLSSCASPRPQALSSASHRLRPQALSSAILLPRLCRSRFLAWCLLHGLLILVTSVASITRSNVFIFGECAHAPSSSLTIFPLPRLISSSESCLIDRFNHTR
jgi:hypothetical protein